MDNYFITVLTRRSLFLFSLATAKWGVYSGSVTSCFFLFVCCWSGICAGVGGQPEAALRPLSCSFEVPSLGDFAAGMPEDLLRCPVRAFSEYLDRTSGIVIRPRRLFVSSTCPSRAMSKNEISYMLRAFIIQSSASSRCGQVPRATSIGGIATSSAFFRNWSLQRALEVASWRANKVFTSFYLRGLSFPSDGVHSFGPFVAAGERIR